MAYVNFFVQVLFCPLECTTLYYDLISQVLRKITSGLIWTFLFGPRFKLCYYYFALVIPIGRV